MEVAAWGWCWLCPVAVRLQRVLDCRGNPCCGPWLILTPSSAAGIEQVCARPWMVLTLAHVLFLDGVAPCRPTGGCALWILPSVTAVTAHPDAFPAPLSLPAVASFLFLLP